MEFLQAVTGFVKGGSIYHVARACNNPPALLQLQVFPETDSWFAYVENHHWERAFKDEESEEDDDFAALNLLHMLKHMQVFLLQDLAVLQPDYPHLPAFQHPLFASAEWTE